MIKPSGKVGNGLLGASKLASEKKFEVKKTKKIRSIEDLKAAYANYSKIKTAAKKTNKA